MVLRPYPVGEWQTRAQVSTLLLPKAAADELLDQKRLFIGAARGRDAAHRAPAVFGLDSLELRRRVADGLLPAHFPPRVVMVSRIIGFRMRSLCVA